MGRFKTIPENLETPLEVVTEDPVLIEQVRLASIIVDLTEKLACSEQRLRENIHRCHELEEEIKHVKNSWTSQLPYVPNQYLTQNQYQQLLHEAEQRGKMVQVPGQTKNW